MKQSIILLINLICLISSFAQTPNSFNYQAVLRNASGNVRADENVSLEIEILQGTPTGTSVFSEMHNATTNSFGLVNLKIGSINSTGFTGINWANGPYFIKIEVNGTVMGTSQLLNVPYALYAKTAESVDFSGDETAFENWDRNASDDVLITGDQIISGLKTFSRVITSEGIALPNAFGPNTDYIGVEGNYIAFGHSGVSEDFTGYE